MVVLGVSCPGTLQLCSRQAEFAVTDLQVGAQLMPKLKLLFQVYFNTF